MFAAEHPELPLAVANDMRNALAHGYFKVDLDIAWETIHSELPPLQARVSDLQLGPLNHLRAFIWRGAPSDASPVKCRWFPLDNSRLLVHDASLVVFHLRNGHT